MAEYFVLEQQNMKFFSKFVPAVFFEDAQKGNSRIIGALEKQVVVGATNFSVVGNTAIINYLSVSPDYENKKIAHGMLEFLETISAKLGVDQITTAFPEKSETAPKCEKIVTNLGYHPDNEMEIARFLLKDLLDANVVKFFKGKKLSAQPLSRIPQQLLTSFNSEAVSDGRIDVPLKWDSYDKNLSFIKLNQAQKIESCICSSVGTDCMAILWLYSDATDNESKAELLTILSSFASKLYGEDFPVETVIEDDEAKKLIKIFLEPGKNESYSRVLRYTKSMLE
ncbi:MAG: GNAT family N-acetyltransferase [Clostridia bacterium]|nr:GNAT family N-acetyltransferase [Clostridia bacterium]